MREDLSFSVDGNTIHVNGKDYETLEFVDICAGTRERLDHWRKNAEQEGMAPERIAASMAIDKDPLSNGVHKLKVIPFLRSLPDRSVHIVNGDYFCTTKRKHRIPGDDSTWGYKSIAYEVERVLADDGEFWMTMSLQNYDELAAAITNARLQMQAVAFGYVGFLGGENRYFGPEKLPPVEGITDCTRIKLDSTEAMEERNPLAVCFAEQIGVTGYTDGNPVRYKARRIKRS